MSSILRKQLKDALNDAVEKQQFHLAEQAVTHLKNLAELEAFIEGKPGADEYTGQHLPAASNQGVVDLLAPVPGTGNPNDNESASRQHAVSAKRDMLLLYYIEEEDLIKFKKSPQTYAVSVDFFRSFLDHLIEWKNKSPFSSKDYYEAFGRKLGEKSTYQTSTLRQFITLLFRYCVRLGLLEKPEIHQRSRYVVADDSDVEKTIQYIKSEKMLQL